MNTSNLIITQANLIHSETGNELTVNSKRNKSGQTMSNYSNSRNRARGASTNFLGTENMFSVNHLGKGDSSEILMERRSKRKS